MARKSNSRKLLLLICDEATDDARSLSLAAYGVSVAFNCSCCSVCKFLLVNFMDTESLGGVAAILTAFAFIFALILAGGIGTGFNAANLDTACGATRVIQT